MNKKIDTYNLILFVLTFLGLALSAYLWYFQVNPDQNIPCTNDGCGHILSSPYSFIFGIPMAVYGFFFYAFLATLIFQRFFTKEKILENLIKLSLLAGLVFSLYLRYLEFFKIGAICPWCWVSFMIVLALCTTYLLKPKSSGK